MQNSCIQLLRLYNEEEEYVVHMEWNGTWRGYNQVHLKRERE